MQRSTCLSETAGGGGGGAVVVRWWCGGGVVVVWWCGGAVVVRWWCGAVVRWWCGGGAVVVRWWCGGGAVVVRWCVPMTRSHSRLQRKKFAVAERCAIETITITVCTFAGETDYKTDTCEINNKKHTTRRENSK